jgi:hypothetical protein
VGSPRPARTQNFAWQLVRSGRCESKIAVSLGVVSFLWFVSLDKQRNERPAGKTKSPFDLKRLLNIFNLSSITFSQQSVCTLYQAFE